MSLKTRPTDARDAEIGRLKEKVGDLTMVSTSCPGESLSSAGQVEDMPRSRVAVQLRRERHAGPAAGEQVGDLRFGQSLDLAPFQVRVRRRFGRRGAHPEYGGCHGHEEGSTHAAFKTDLERTLRAEIGQQLWDESFEVVQKKYGTVRKDAQKIPSLMREVLMNCAEHGGDFKTLNSIFDAIIAYAELDRSGSSEV